MADFNIGVVTSAWGDYGRYLPEWIDSVEAQTVKPAKITIIDAGMTDSLAARLRLAECSISWRWKRIRYSGMGNARNAAVEATDTEWVMHLDADDTLFPYAIADIAGCADRADVVSVGAVRDGTVILHRWASTERALMGLPVCFSCAAFRRSFWERRPWIETNDWIDSVFWVGLAHLSAKITSVRRPGFHYRTHADSHSRSMTPDQRAEAFAQLKRLTYAWDL